ncbi:MAG: TonB-dependent receptor [Acidobacteriia bacterium]|nr:TonB-dependent receptor [Terriglobia bacterium]
MPSGWRLHFAAWLVAVSFCLANPVALHAQYTVGRVEGTIMDASDEGIAGATVTLRSVGTNAKRTYVTSHDGFYVFFAVPPGNYEISAEAPEFALRTVSLQVVTNQTVTLNLNLAVGPQSTVVEVVGTAPGQLDVSDSQRSTTRTDEELVNLPSLGRNMISLVHLAAGVVPTNNPRGGSTFGGGGSYVLVLGPQAGLFSANGGREASGAVQLDYTDANDWEFGGFALGMQSITPDMLQEFKLLTSNFSAEYGVKSNAQVMMVTKSGTNNWHGSAYDFIQNDLFNARDYFDQTGKPSPIKSNVYGFTMGGPVVRDRSFLFGAYEGRVVRGGAFTSIATLPTQSARSRATDPVVVDLMNRFLPLPTGPTSDPDVGTLTTQIPSPVDAFQFVLKGDHHFSAHHALSLRYFHSTGTFVARAPGQNSLPGFDTDIHSALRNMNITDSYVLSSRTVNELHLAYGYASALSLPQQNLTSPRFQILGLVNFGALPSNPAGRTYNVYQVSDILSHIRGSHVLKTGVDIRKIQDNSLFAQNAQGVFTFATLNGFLAGQPSSWTQLFGNTQRGFRTGLYGFFFQDDWKATPTLTFNLGFRWEIQGALGESQGLSSVLDPQTPGPIGAAGSGPLGSFRVGNSAVESNPFNLAPRLGFAWNPRNGNFVLRGGYGVYWDSFTFESLTASRSVPPLNYNFSLACVPGLPCQISGANSFANLLNGSAPILAQGNNQVGSFGNLTNFGSITSVDPRLNNPYVQDFSLGIEYRFPKSYVFSLGYVGTKGTHLTRLIPINPIVPGTGKRLDPRFNQVNFHDDGGSSIFHSLQAEVRKAFSHGLQFQASYSWSKSIDDGSDFRPTIQANDNSFAQDPFNLRGERAVSNFDIPHRLVVTGIWRTPFFNNSRGFVGKVLRGWSFQSVNMWQSGLAATVLSGPRAGIVDVNQDGNLIDVGTALDNTRANCSPTGVRFELGDPSVNFGFSQPLLGTNGTCSRDVVRMRRLVNFDWSFFKDIELKELGPLGSGPWNLQFRAEFYNIFNIPFLTAQGNNWRTISSPSFGSANAAGITRRVQFALKLSW